MAPAIPPGLGTKESDSSTSSIPPGFCTDDSDSSTDSPALLSAATPKSSKTDGFDVMRDTDILICAYEMINLRPQNYIPDALINELVRDYRKGDPKFDLSPGPLKKLRKTLNYRIQLSELSKSYIDALGLPISHEHYQKFSYTHWRFDTTEFQKTFAHGAMMSITDAKIFPGPRSYIEGRRFDKPMQYMSVAYANACMGVFQVRDSLAIHREALEKIKWTFFSPVPEDQPPDLEAEEFVDVEIVDSDDHDLALRRMDSRLGDCI